MTGKELFYALDALGISQARFARLVDANKDTPTNWIHERTAIPGSVRLLVRILIAGWVTIEQLEAL